MPARPSRDLQVAVSFTADPLSRVQYRKRGTHPMRKIIILLSLVVGFGGTALASEKCSVPMDDWQPREALQTKLEGEGWKVRAIKMEDGCYEAYAVSAEGKKIEAYFNPQTFQSVNVKIED